MNRCSTWKPVVKKIEDRLASWKAKLLSRAGRLTLIKSVLNSLPVYFMSMFKMPKAIVMKIVKLQRRFFWGGRNDANKGYPSVKWADIQLPREMGGLGVGNIMHRNLVLLFKWWWRFSESDNTLWKRILQSVHNIKGVKASSESFLKVREGSWAQMLSNEQETANIRMIVEEGMLLTVGGGNSILFWHDKWCESGILKTSFPRLFSLSSQKNSLINQMRQWNGNIWIWNLQWRRALFQWESEEVRRFKEIIVRNGPSRERKDGIMWKFSGDTSYPTMSITAKVNESFSPTLPKQITNIVWQKFVPPRAKLIVCLANLEKLKTGDFLVGKGIINPQDALCPFCSLEIESNSHIIFTCRFAWSIWMEILKWWSLSTALHNRCNNFCSQWLGLQKLRKARNFWGLTLGCVIWSLWFERNQIKFNHKSPNLKIFVQSLKIRIGIWAKEMLGYKSFAPQNVIFNLDSNVLQV